MTTEAWSSDYMAAPLTPRARPDYASFSQATKDALLLTACFEQVMGGPGDGAFWSAKIQQLLDAGAVLRPEEEINRALCPSPKPAT